jgi:hypothetical protein
VTILYITIRLLLLRFKGKVYNSTFIIINKYIKIIYYILIIKEIIIAKLVKLFILYIIKNFNIFNNIILNKKVIFINNF